MKKTTKLFSLILVLGMMMGIFVALGITASAEDGYSGTPVAPTQITSDNYHLYGFTDSNWSAYNGYYAITNAEELYGWRETLGNENLGNAVLINDIVVNTGDMVAAGDAGTPPAYTWPAIDRFKGVLDGRGHSISGLYIVEGSDGTYEYTAFIELLGGEIKNLVISNTFVDASSAYNSVIAADEWLSEGISNVKIDSNVKIKASGSFGAFICDTGDVTLTNCVSLANIIIDGGRYIGSIVGRAGDEPTFTNCYYTSGPAGVGDNLSSYDATGMSEVSVASHTCIAMEHPKVIASCYAKGSTAYTDCMICGKVLSGTKSVTDYSHGDITYTAHATDAEKHVATCVDCDQNFEEVHSFGTTDTCPCGETADVSLTTVSTVTYYATLEDAIAAARIAASGSTVTLLDDCSPVSGNWFTVSDGKFTIDLNGKQITVANSAYSAIVVESGNITLTDSAGGGGSNGGAHVRGGGTLRVEGGTYGGTVSTTNGNLIVVAGSFAVVSLDYDANPGTLTVMGGDIATLQVRAQTGGKKMSDVLLQDYYLADANGVLIDPASAQLSDTYFYYLENVTVQKGADLSTYATVTVENAIYNGSLQVPQVTVTVMGRELMMGVDFSFTYPEGYDITGAGKTELTIKGIGRYTGEKTATYTIEKAVLTEGDITPSGLNTTYNLNPQTVSVSLPTGLDAQYVKVGYSQGGTTLTDLPKNAGTYDVSISVVGSPNYNDAFFQNKWQLVIEPKEAIVTVGALGTEEYFFNGYPHTPTVFLDLGVLPAPSTEFEGCTVTYENNTQVGTAKVIVGGNYKGEATFVIQKGKPTIGLTSPLDKVMPGYVLTLTPTTNAIDNSYYTTTFTIEDGDGYSVDGFKITIDSGVAINDVITVKVKSTETATYQAATGELKLTVGVPVIDTSELENDINELNNLIESKADADDIAQKLTDITDRIQALEAIKEAYKDADTTLKTELEGTIADAKTELEKRIEGVQTNLDNAKSELDKAIADLEKAMKKGDEDLSAALANLNVELINAKVILEKADAENKAELVKKIEDADKVLDDAIKAVQKDLDDAKTALNKAIADGDTALDGKITALNEALATAKAALEATDATTKSELTAKIDEADADLQAAIDALSSELSNVKQKTAELESKNDELQSFIIVVCVISGIALCGSGAFVVWFFIDRKKI